MVLGDDAPGVIAMVRAPAHHLSAGVVEDDHTVLQGGHPTEGDELAYLELMGDGEGRPSLVDECVIAFSPRSHPPAAASVCADDDVRRDGSEPLDELVRDRELAEGGLEDDAEELVRPYLVVEVADVCRPSTTLLRRSLVGNLSRCHKHDLLSLPQEHMSLEMCLLISSLDENGH